MSKLERPDREQPTDMAKPSIQDARQVVYDMLNSYMTATGCLPAPMPCDPGEALGWALDYLFEPPAASERPRRANKVEGVVWIFPYQERIEYLVRKFLSLEDERDRRLIVRAREDGIYWRGDDLEWFAQYAANAVVIQGGDNLEVGEAFLKMRELARKQDKRNEKLRG